MKVILLKELEKYGKPYDTIEVKDGFARNYLLPRNLAVEATPGNIEGIKKSQQRFSKQAERIKRKSMNLAEKINSVSINASLRIGIDGKSFGAITAQNLSELLKKEEIDVDKKHISLEEPVKHAGEYVIEVHLPEKVKAAFKLIVTAEGGEAAAGE